MNNHKQIYQKVTDILSNGRVSRRELIYRVMQRITKNELTNNVGKETELRGKVGYVIDEMEYMKIITVDDDGRYTLLSDRPIILRVEKCEKEILNLLKESPMSRSQIRSRLENLLGTNKTASTKDDNILYTYIGQILKRLSSSKVIDYNGSVYSIASEKVARIENMEEILALQNDFLVVLHSKGGEFFEHYFMTLLGKYLLKHGKNVTENSTTGGTNDGGIDGIIKTVDSLGFKETLMVQTKNRLEFTSETAIRGFYGSVCAYQGSRGIYATTSDFHPSAIKFLDNIDNCIGINGKRIFEMACECQYGVKKKEGKYVIDKNIF